MLIINAVILFILDFYIFFALHATKIKLVHKKWFGYAWWAYSILLLTGVFIGMKYNIPLTYRSIILVAFFLTATCKFFFFLVILIDDIRRGGVWISRLLRPIRKKEQLEDRIKEIEKPLPEEAKKGISRSEFLMKSGIVIASLPILPLGWGIVSGAYDYRIRRKNFIYPICRLPFMACVSHRFRMCIPEVFIIKKQLPAV